MCYTAGMIRIGVIGCGRILNAHLRGFRLLREAGLGDFRITALAARGGKIDDARQFCRRGWAAPRAPATSDPSHSLAAPYTPVSDFQDDVQALAYDDYHRMLADEVCDAVLNTTPVDAHFQASCDCLRAGKHVLVQKPIALNISQARQMQALAEERGLVLGVVETARYLESTRAQRWAFDSGLLGQPQLAMMVTLGGRWSPNLITAGTAWRHQQQRSGGGIAIDIGVHIFNRLRYVLGEVLHVAAMTDILEPVRVNRDPAGNITEQTGCDVEDTFMALARFGSGAKASLAWSWALHGEPAGIDGGTVMFGSRGCLKGDLLYTDAGPAGKLGERFFAEADAEQLARWFPAGVRDGFALNQYDWLRCLSDRTHTMETSAAEGLRDLAASFAVVESARSGRTVDPSELLNEPK